MTEDEARARCAQLAATHKDRETHQFLPRRDKEGGWQVVKVALPPLNDETTAEQRSEPRPSLQDDPRSAHDRNVGPWVGPG